MKSKSVLLAATLALFIASAATVFAAVEQRTDAQAGQAETAKAKNSEPEKPVKSGRHAVENTGATAGFTLEDLFGCKPMGEDVHHTLPEPVSGMKQQETMQPMQ